MNFKEMYQSILKEFPDILTIDEMSMALGVSRKTCYKLINEGKVPHLKVGRSYRIPKLHLLAYLKITLPAA